MYVPVAGRPWRRSSMKCSGDFQGEHTYRNERQELEEEGSRWVASNGEICELSSLLPWMPEFRSCS